MIGDGGDVIPVELMDAALSRELNAPWLAGAGEGGAVKIECSVWFACRSFWSAGPVCAGLPLPFELLIKSRFGFTNVD